MPQDASPPAQPRLDHVETWIFDLDNTLYPAACDLFSQIDERMGSFISELLGVDRVAARRVQKTYFLSHGTTLRGLMDEHGVAPGDFLRHVHDIDVDPIVPDPRLGRALERLDGRRYVFTNATARHAERVLERLGIRHLIHDIFDIAAADYYPKPQAVAYERFVGRFGIVPARTAMIEDMARNLAPAAALGMTTVWLETAYRWADVEIEADAIHHHIGDLVTFLEAQAPRAFHPATPVMRPRE